MIIDMRIYTYVPAQFASFVKTYSETGNAIVTRHLGHMGGVFISTSGRANRTLQLFGYEDNDHRDQCRKALRVDPAWLDFIRSAAPAISAQDNMIVRPVANSSMQDMESFKALAATTKAEDRLFELRTRTFRPGQAAFVASQTAQLDRQLRAAVGEELLAELTADTGLSDRLISLSAYRDATAREQVHARLAGSADMTAVMATMYPAMLSEERDLWLPLPCSSLR